jgi:hypothetical protein
MDIVGIQPGDEFEDVIRDGLARTDVVLALIGDRWLETRAADGSRRIDDPHDVLRRELAIALDEGRRVIPLLLDGATMPKASDLPDDIAPIARRSAYSIRHERFPEDMRKLADVIGNLPTGKDLPRGSNPARLQVNQEVIDRLKENFRTLIDIATPDAFLIVEDEEERFIQFTGATETQVLVDLPSIGLSTEQLAAANQLFLDSFGMVNRHMFSEKDFSFTMRAPADTTTLARLVVEVFQKVYGVTPHQPLKARFGR